MLNRSFSDMTDKTAPTSTHLPHIYTQVRQLQLSSIDLLLKQTMLTNHSCCQWKNNTNGLVCCIKATKFGEIMHTTRPLRPSRSFKVTDFGTNRKPICNFLLVINSNLPPILHRFQVMAATKECLTLTPLLGVIPCEYLDKLYLSRNYNDCPTRCGNRTIMSSFIWT